MWEKEIEFVDRPKTNSFVELFAPTIYFISESGIKTVLQSLLPPNLVQQEPSDFFFIVHISKSANWCREGAACFLVQESG